MAWAEEQDWFGFETAEEYDEHLKLIDEMPIVSFAYPEYIWITKDGKKINVRDMTDSHLANAIKMLQKQSAEPAMKWITILSNELKNRTNK